MTTVLTVIGVLVAVLVVVVLVAYLVGRTVPLDHVIVGELTLKASPERVFEAFDRIEEYPKWTRFKRVEALPPDDGKERWNFLEGRNSFVITVRTRESPRLLRHEIADNAEVFSGAWDVTFTPAPSGGTTIVLTENGRVTGAIPRFMMKYVVDAGMYVRQHLASLAKHMGEDAAPVVKRAV
ncbi:MAG: SRPBCC family protein [Phycisphaerales bacterium]|nr:SRPBCC family protein [Phycisphaerales bacterium]